MSLQIIEGKLIKIIKKKDVNKIIKELKDFNGYIRLSTKREGHFEEGYLFFKNNSIIGYYYIYDEIEEFGSRSLNYIENMKNKNPDVELYEYTEEELNIMMEMVREIFLSEENKNIDDLKFENTEFEDNEYGRLYYYNIKLILPEGKPLKMDAGKDYNEYLKNYVLLEIFKKENNKFKRGYIIYYNKTPILSAYEYDNKVLFGKDSCLVIKKLLKYPKIIIDIYEYNAEKVEILLENYPQMRLKDENTLSEIIDKKKKGLLGESIYNNILNQEKKDNAKDIEDKPLNKEELLKKFNIRMPDEDVIDNIIKEIFTPSCEDLENIKNDLIEKISKYLKTYEEIKSFEIDLDVYYKEGEYYCKCNVKLKFKKTLGLDLIFKGGNQPLEDDKLIQDIRQNIIDVLSNYPLDLNPKMDIEIN